MTAMKAMFANWLDDKKLFSQSVKTCIFCFMAFFNIDKGTQAS